jgi:CBS domain-containing protein
MQAHQVMTREVVTVGPETSIFEAAKIMLRNHISGLPVINAGGEVIGIVSEGDFLRRAEVGTQRRSGRWLALLFGTNRIAANFVRERSRKVGDIMIPTPLTVTEDTPLDRIVQIMELHNVKRLPVLRGTHLTGIVTRSDILAAIAHSAPNIRQPSSDDHRIRSDVLATIEQATWRPARLNVSVWNGVVHLRGFVTSEVSRKAAIVAAENVPGVRQVRDELRSYPPPEEDYGGGDFVSPQEEPSTLDDTPL